MPVDEIDNHAIDFFEGKFKGSFDIPYETGVNQTMDKVVSILVTGVIGPPTYKTNKDGFMIRVNTVQIEEANVVPVDKVVSTRIAATGEVAEASEPEQDDLFDDDDELPEFDHETGEVYA